MLVKANDIAQITLDDTQLNCWFDSLSLAHSAEMLTMADKLVHCSEKVTKLSKFEISHNSLAFTCRLAPPRAL